jgi:hypothetical protein
MQYEAIKTYAFDPYGKFLPLGAPERHGSRAAQPLQPQYRSPGAKVDALAREMLRQAGPCSQLTYSQCVEHVLAHDDQLRQDFARWGY